MPQLDLVSFFSLNCVMSKPPTKRELAEEKLREINGRLSVVKRMLGSSTEGAAEKAERASKRVKDASGEARFVKIGGCMVEGTDRLQALMDLEDSYTDLLDLQGKDPLDEAEKLLVKKIDVLKYLVKGSASSSGS